MIYLICIYLFIVRYCRNFIMCATMKIFNATEKNTYLKSFKILLKLKPKIENFLKEM